MRKRAMPITLRTSEILRRRRIFWSIALEAQCALNMRRRWNWCNWHLININKIKTITRDFSADTIKKTLIDVVWWETLKWETCVKVLTPFFITSLDFFNNMKSSNKKVGEMKEITKVWICKKCSCAAVMKNGLVLYQMLKCSRAAVKSNLSCLSTSAYSNVIKYSVKSSAE